MDFSLQTSLSEDGKKEVGEWIKTTLESMAVDCDDVFVQYVMVMVTGAKTMEEMASELEAIIGQPEALDFVSRY